MMRPALSPNMGADEFLAWYWLKHELQAFCREQGWPTSGSKAALMQRVQAALAGRALPAPSGTTRRTGAMPTVFEPATRVGEGWRLTAALRTFFVQHLGAGFRFNQVLRDFFRAPQGRTLADALALWFAAQQNPPAAIERQFQFNQHVRDFFAQHPGASRVQMLQAWREKRQTAQALVFSDLFE